MIVHVQDSGVGIEAEDIPKLFSKFGKLHRTADINSEGIGLGLTIVKQIIEASGGKVTVESEGLGKGSLFIFSMMMKRAPVGKSERQTEEQKSFELAIKSIENDLAGSQHDSSKMMSKGAQFKSMIDSQMYEQPSKISGLASSECQLKSDGDQNRQRQDSADIDLSLIEDEASECLTK